MIFSFAVNFRVSPAVKSGGCFFTLANGACPVMGGLISTHVLIDCMLAVNPQRAK
jgi:hypothetical protein